jgi:hypothetical protein
MAIVTVEEFTLIVRDNDGMTTPCAQYPSLTVQTMTPGASAGSLSTAFNAKTRFIRVATDTEIHYTIGSDPTATTSNSILPANTWEYYGVLPGHNISVRTTA